MKCCECKHCASAYLTSLDGQGVFQAHLCQVDIVNPVVVDGGVERECLQQPSAKLRALQSWEVILILTTVALWGVIIGGLLGVLLWHWLR